MILAPMRQVGWRRACSGVIAANSAAGVSRNGPPDAVRISRSTCARFSPTRHCQIAECSESIGRSQPSGLRQRIRRIGRAALLGTRSRPGHDEVPPGDERLLVRGCHDLARVERGDDRSEADDAAGPDEDDVDVRRGSPARASASSPPRTSVPGGQAASQQVPARRVVRDRHDGRAAAAPPARPGRRRGCPPRGRRPGTTGRRRGPPRACRPIEPVDPRSATPARPARVSRGRRRQRSTRRAPRRGTNRPGRGGRRGRG